MKELHSLYDQFRKTVLEEENIWELEPFENNSFWEELTVFEKKKLAYLFLERASSTEFESLLFTSLHLAESLFPSDIEILCKGASILHVYGMLKEEEKFYFLALNKFLKAKESDPASLQNNAEWLHLWGNIWISLGCSRKESSFLQKGLNKYKQAARVMKDLDNREFFSKLYWDWGVAWVLMGKGSQEPLDLQQGIKKLKEAADLGCHLPAFHIDYGEALAALGQINGEAARLEQAVLLFQTAIIGSDLREKEPSEEHVRAWVGYACAFKCLFELTHSRDCFQKANSVFQQAIIIAPSSADLWLKWGELYLHSGWLNHNIQDIETALDKLTSLKVKECDPLSLSALLGKGLALLGLCLEDLHPLDEAAKRIETTIELAPDHAGLLAAKGTIFLGHGIYFSDAKYFEKSVAYFEKSLEKDATSVESWYGLFQAYLEWGLNENETSLVRKAIRAIKRAASLRPEAAFYFSEWGIALLRLRHIEPNSSTHHMLILEALDLFKRGWELQEEIDILYSWGCALDLLGDITADPEDYEQAIEILTIAYQKEPNILNIRYRLALALSHYGELTSHIESIYRAIELFKSLPSQDESVLCDYGYTFLTLSELIYDANHPQKAMSFRREAEKRLMQAAEFGSGEAFYHLACLYSLSGLNETSIHYLEKADAMGCLPPIEDVEHDEWLEKIRHTRAFQEFLMICKQEK
ncbi:MAG: hypothetical protein WAM28_05295 [Chlamydiales bacterium]